MENTMGGKSYNYSSRVTDKSIQKGLIKLKERYEFLINNNQDLSVEQILKNCKISGKDKDEFKVYITCSFNFEKIMNNINISKYLFVSDNLLKRLCSFKARTTDNNRYVELLKDISFLTSGINSDVTKSNVFKAGRKIKFAYQTPNCALIVCHFGNNLFPLAEGEFKWL